MSGRFEKVPLREFIERRRQGTASAQAAALTNPNLIVVDAGDDIICDVCNASVDEDPLYLNSFGLYCQDCRRRS